MSEPITVLSILNERIPAKAGVLKVHDFLIAHDGHIRENCFFRLNDTNDIEIETDEEVINTEESLKKIYKWPTLGYIDYWMLKGLMTVFFWSRIPGQLEVVHLSILDCVYNNDPIVKTFYNELTNELHEMLKAKRTILGWNLKDFGFSWEEELKRLEKNIFLEHKILEVDLRY